MIRLEMPRDVRIWGRILISCGIVGSLQTSKRRMSADSEMDKRRASGGQAEQKLAFRSNRTEK